MRAKEYLRQLKRLDTLIDLKNKELDDLQLRVKSIGSMNFSEERVQTSLSEDAPFVKLIEKIVDLQAEINAEINIFVDTKHRIISQIQALKNPNHISLLYKRYVEYKNLVQISFEMNFSYDHIKHLHGCALEDFEHKILNSTRHNTVSVL